jgi:hypothetical protein
MESRGLFGTPSLSLITNMGTLAKQAPGCKLLEYFAFTVAGVNSF